MVGLCPWCADVFFEGCCRGLLHGICPRFGNLNPAHSLLLSLQLLPWQHGAGSLLTEGSTLGLSAGKIAHGHLTTKMKGMQEARQPLFSCCLVSPACCSLPCSGSPEAEKHVFCLSRCPSSVQTAVSSCVLLAGTCNKWSSWCLSFIWIRNW